MTPAEALRVAVGAVREGRLDEASAMLEGASAAPGLDGLLASKIRQSIAELRAAFMVVDHRRAVR